MDFTKLLQLAKTIQDAIINENTAHALDIFGDYAKESAALIRKLESQAPLMSADVEGGVCGPLDEICRSTLECESKCRNKFNSSNEALQSATKAGFEAGESDPTKAVDPATILFLFQTVIAIAKMIRERRQGK